MKVNIRKVVYYSVVGPVTAAYLPLLLLNAGLNWCTERVIDFFGIIQRITKCFDNESRDKQSKPNSTKQNAPDGMLTHTSVADSECCKTSSAQKFFQQKQNDMEIEYTKEQVRAARRATKALNELSESGLHLIWHCATGNIYGVPKEMRDEVENSNTNDYLPCGIIDDGGDW